MLEARQLSNSEAYLTVHIPTQNVSALAGSSNEGIKMDIGRLENCKFLVLEFRKRVS